MMLLSSLTLLLAPVLIAAQSKRCLPSGDERQINAAFKNGGKGTIVSLCPGSSHKLNDSIVFTAARQTLTTLGDPKGFTRALLVVEGPDQATAIQADCKQCHQATVKSLIIDGNRPTLLRTRALPAKAGPALVEMGNANEQVVRDCKLYEPRGWSTLHFREGDDKNCQKAYIGYNELGPSGEEWDYEYDGDGRETSKWGDPWADGISLACMNSVVEYNIVVDTTDAGIVLFGSAGTEVKENDIYSRTRMIQGGINLVDYEPWAGDYSNVQIHNNRIHADGRFFRVGIAIGTPVWHDDTELMVSGKGSIISDNSFSGPFFGYGIVISNANGFTVLRNKLERDAKFGGVPGPICPKVPENHAPTAFLLNKGSAKGSFQTEFLNGNVQQIICILPAEANGGRPYVPFRFRDSPAAIAAKAKEAGIVPDGFDDKLAEALMTYQQSLTSSLGEIDQLLLRSPSPKVEGVGKKPKGGLPAKKQPTKAGAPGRGGNAELEKLMKRLENVERGDKKMRAAVDGLQEDFGVWAEHMKRHSDERKPILEMVNRAIILLSSPRFKYRGGWSSSIRDALGWLAWSIPVGLVAYIGWQKWRTRRTNKGAKVL